MSRTDASRPFQRCRILLVDYDADLLGRLRVLLADEGYDVTAAWSGREALAIIGSRRFDVVLLRDHLPDIDARELWRLLRKVPSDADLALLQGSDPLTEEVRALFLDYAHHCLLPRTTPEQIASAIVHCLCHRSTPTSATGGMSGAQR